MSETPPSRVTGGATSYLFTARLLGRHHVRYYRCRDTGFIQTEAPYWLEEAYASAISSLDTGCVARNLVLRDKTIQVCDALVPAAGRFLDFGGGYGLLVRLMRDAGYDFVRSDPYCENLFARGFDVSDRAEPGRYDLATAFEVFEHWPDPVAELAKLFDVTDSVLASTEIVPDRPLRSADDWHYFSTLGGQHVSFFTSAALERLAASFGARLYSDGRWLHLMTRIPGIADPFTRPVARVGFPKRVVRKVARVLNRLAIDEVQPRQPRESLVMPDHEAIKTRIKAAS